MDAYPGLAEVAAGVHGIPEGLDEYDSYVGQVARRLRDGAGVEDIATYLGDPAKGLLQP